MHGWNTFPETANPSSGAPGSEAKSSADRARFEQWCELAEEWILSTLGSIALSRSAELAARTDLHVRVVQASTAHVPSGRAPRFRVVSLALGGSRVDLYSTREPGETPSIHFAITREPTMCRFPAITSLPGCLIVRRDNGEIALLGAPTPGLSGMRPSVSFESIVFRAFELLVGAHRSAKRVQHQN